MTMIPQMQSTNGAHGPTGHQADIDVDQLYAWMPGLEPTPQPLPEARASANVRVTMAAREVQITLRDHDEGRLLERLTAVLAQFPVEQAAAKPQSTAEGWCSRHGVEMTLNTKNNRQWWSHRTADGQWCKGKPGR